MFLIGVLGIVLNRQSIRVIIMGIESMLLALNQNFVRFFVCLDDMIGELFSLFTLAVAASESSIGLAIVICFFIRFGYIFLKEETDVDYKSLRG